MNDAPATTPVRLVLVTGATGKVGSRVLARLDPLGVPTRGGSRVAAPPFDWARPESWPVALGQASAAFVSYYPDLGFPGGAEAIGAFARSARTAGVERLVLLSGRGEPEAARSEAALQAAGVAWTVLRCSWFAQNFSEHFLLGPVLDGVIALPAENVTEPFVDLEDVADVAVAALLDSGHTGRTYELTGPESLSFGDVAEVIGGATGRTVRHVTLTPAQFVEDAVAAGVPADEAHGLADLFVTVLDGRNAHTTSDVERVLGRPAGSFAAYARRTAATGIWNQN
jgi:uncharacterized protein YbjT (DUF2867 family)